MNPPAICFLSGDSYVARSTMREIQNKLSPVDFIRIHRSYIVRVDKIDEINDTSLLIGRKRIPVSKSHKGVLRSNLSFV